MSTTALFTAAGLARVRKTFVLPRGLADAAPEEGEVEMDVLEMIEPISSCLYCQDG